jgi:hypothetical protein
MKIPTATFQDTYFGATKMALVPVKTTRRGARVIRFRWEKVADAVGCITTGFAGTFPTIGAAISAASRHASFSNVAA